MLALEDFNRLSPCENLLPVLREIKEMLKTSKNPKAPDYGCIINDFFFDLKDRSDAVRLRDKILSALDQNEGNVDRLANWLVQVDSEIDECVVEKTARDINQVVFWNAEAKACSDDFLNGDELRYYAREETDSRGRNLALNVSFLRVQHFSKHSDVPTICGTPFQVLMSIYADLAGLAIKFWN